MQLKSSWLDQFNRLHSSILWKLAFCGFVLFASSPVLAKAPTRLNCEPLRIQAIYSDALEAFISKRFAASLDFYKSLLTCPLSRTVSASVHLGLGRNYQELSLKEESIREYGIALGYNNSLYQAFTNRGLVLASLGRLKEAINDFNSAITLDPQNYIALTNRGVAYATIGKFSLAIRDFDLALKANPGFGEAYLNRGIIFELSGDLPRACTDWKSALKLRQFSAKTWIDTQCR